MNSTMNMPFTLIVGAALLVFFVWLLIPTTKKAPGNSNAELLDPSDSRQLGMLVGMFGGTVADAAVARFAIERFESIYGRKATTLDVGIVIGLMRGGMEGEGGGES